jgi:hypothetical protein
MSRKLFLQRLHAKPQLWSTPRVIDERIDVIPFGVAFA